MVDLSDIKRNSRLAMFNGMAVEASYEGPEDDAEPRDVRVRWHNKMQPALGIERGGAGIVEGIERLIFNGEQLAAPLDGGEPIILERNGVVTIPGYNLVCTLDNEGVPDGPVNVYWSVTSNERG